MRSITTFALCAFILAGSLALIPEASASRIKDVARWEGVEENVVIGIGVVVGLQGTGDGGQTVRDYLRNAMGSLETDIDPRTLRPKNAALVTVTASLPAFSRKGNVIDITVSSMGDAKSLVGGTLLPTPLRDMEGRAVWAVAQGSLTVGGFSASATGSTATTSGWPRAAPRSRSASRSRNSPTPNCPRTSSPRTVRRSSGRSPRTSWSASSRCPARAGSTTSATR